MQEAGAELGWPGYRVRPVQRWRGSIAEEVDDCIAEEAPIALMYNGEPHVVMLATPLDLEDFALGFSLTENIVTRVEDIQSVGVYPRRDGIEVRVTLPAEFCDTLMDKGRNMTGRTGCGLCGARTLQQAVKRPPPVRSTLRVTAGELMRTLSALRAQQRLNQITGAVHAAAWAMPGDAAMVVREDVGRHNALDKLIGVLARKKTDFGAGFVVVTSRASFEMVQKCAMVGIGLLAAISAPTGLAIRQAEESGLTLIGFARDQDHVVYANPQRLIHESP